MDDMLVKSKQTLTHLDDLKEILAILKQYQMKLNPSKCALDVASGKFLATLKQYQMKLNRSSQFATLAKLFKEQKPST